MQVETLVTRALVHASLAERMLHDSGPWAMGYGPLLVPAHRVVAEDSVAMRADFPAACHLVRPESLDLYLRGELVASRPVADAGDDGFAVQWEQRVSVTA